MTIQAPSKSKTALQMALTSSEERPEKVALALEGELPKWLTGTLLRNGPGKWEFDDTELAHWFDGMSMIHSFEFADGAATYHNRFIRSRAFRALDETGELAFSEFASDPCRTRFQRVASMFKPNITDNPNVNVFKFGEQFIAMSEIPMAIEFDGDTLETAGVAFKNPDTFATAHPHLDKKNRAMVNLSCKFGPRSSQSFFRMAPDGGKSQRIAKFSRRTPTYQHSFGMSKKWLIFTEFPLVVDPLDILKDGRPFIENYRYKPELGTKITIVNRDTGYVGGEWQADPGFCFHHVNAYEDGDEVVVDLCRFDDASIVEQLYLGPLRNGGFTSAGHLHRYRLVPGRERAIEQRVAEATFELPRINYGAYNGVKYQYAYAVGTGDQSALDRLVKIDVQSGDSLEWHEQNCAVGEPVFVPSPEARAEDDGVILSVVLDGTAGRSFLLVLDAASFTEIARAEVAHVIPAGFHGSFASAA